MTDSLSFNSNLDILSTMKKDAKQIIVDFLELQKNYQFTRRAMMTKERFFDIALKDKNRGLDITDETLKEPLIEHIGHLPILATYLHEHCEHASKIDLGRALIMLAIHDIGETKIGDVFTFTKTQLNEQDELAEARKILSPTLIPYLEEYEENKTFDAKFAKSIDRLAPLLHGMDLIGYIYTRFIEYGGTQEKLISKHRPLLLWDTTLLQIFDLCLEQSARYENGEPLLFPTVDYDLK